MGRPTGSLGLTTLRFHATEIQRLQRERDIQMAGALWLRGYSVKAIAEELQVDYEDVLAAIKESRNIYRAWHEDDILNLAAERIEGFRGIQRQAWDTMGSSPRQSPALLALIQKCEENVAKIQGVLTEKVMHLGKFDVNLKLYDFQDTTPTAIIDGTVVKISSDGAKALGQEILQAAAEEPTIVEGIEAPQAEGQKPPVKAFWKKNLHLEYPGLEATTIPVGELPKLGLLRGLLNNLQKKQEGAN